MVYGSLYLRLPCLCWPRPQVPGALPRATNDGELNSFSLVEARGNLLCWFYVEIV